MNIVYQLFRWVYPKHNELNDLQESFNYLQRQKRKECWQERPELDVLVEYSSGAWKS